VKEEAVNKTEIGDIIAKAQKPLERNPVFRVTMNNDEEIFCEITGGDNEIASAIELWPGESRLVNAKDIVSANQIGQLELLKELSRLKKKENAQKFTRGNAPRSTFVLDG